jgi:putative copper export protein
MHEVLYFVHLTALALWLGTLVVAAWWSRAALVAPDAGSRDWGLRMVSQLTIWVSAPASLLVLLAGVSMVMVAGTVGASRPLWFQVMEQGGGLLVLVSVFLLPALARRVRRATEDQAAMHRAVRQFVVGMGAMAVGVLGVILTVSLRLA